jgi:cysteine and glycine-rich protein
LIYCEMSVSPSPLKKAGAKVTGSMGLIAKLSQMKEGKDQESSGQLSPQPSPPGSKKVSPSPKPSPSTDKQAAIPAMPERSTSPKPPPPPPKAKPQMEEFDLSGGYAEESTNNVEEENSSFKAHEDYGSILGDSAPHSEPIPPSQVETTISAGPPVIETNLPEPPATVTVATPVDSKPPTPSAPAPAPVEMKKGSSLGSLLRAPKCSLCNDNVYKMEELLAIGKTWHKLCFKCGGSAHDGCKRVLPLGKYLEHDSQPYCEACYTKLFRPKGFGFSNALAVDTGSQDNLSDAGSSQPSSTRAVTASAPTSAPEKKTYSASSTPSGGTGSVEARINSFSNPTTPTEASAGGPTMMGGKQVSVSTTSKKIALGGAMAPKCTICAKTVYKVEEVNAVGRIWHKACFKCGGASGNGCGRGLTLDKYVDHENQPFCNACYSKLFKPKGFGFGTNMQPATDA